MADVLNLMMYLFNKIETKFKTITTFVNISVKALNHIPNSPNVLLP